MGYHQFIEPRDGDIEILGEVSERSKAVVGHLVTRSGSFARRVRPGMDARAVVERLSMVAPGMARSKC